MILNEDQIIICLRITCISFSRVPFLLLCNNDISSQNAKPLIRPLNIRRNSDGCTEKVGFTADLQVSRGKIRLSSGYRVLCSGSWRAVF